MGSASVNLIGQRTSATVSGGSVTAASLNMESDTEGNIFSLAGNVSVSVGSGQGNAAGGAVSYTQTGTKTFTVADSTYTVDGQTVVQNGGTLTNRNAGNTASITNATVNTGSGDVNVMANNRSNNQSVAASGAFSDGTFAFTGTATRLKISHWLRHRRLRAQLPRTKDQYKNAYLRGTFASPSDCDPHTLSKLREFLERDYAVNAALRQLAIRQQTTRVAWLPL
jgi:hypothetical protein